MSFDYQFHGKPGTVFAPAPSSPSLGIDVSTGLLYTNVGGGWNSVSGTTLTLKTNGTSNGSQTILNLVAGTGITLSDNGSGAVTVTGSSTGVSSLNSETGAVVLVAGTGISVTPSGQNITIANTQTPVTSLNSETGAVTLVAGSNVTITPSGQNITIAAAGGTGTVTHTGNLDASHVVLGNGTADVTELASLGTTTTVLHGNASGAPSFGTVVEADITLANNTTNNVSTSKHGFTPILPNDATKFLDGTGAYSVPTGSGDTTAKYIIGATDGALTNAIVWPGLSTNPDVPPTSPNSLDDEFDGALDTSTKWAWANQGAATGGTSKSWVSLEVVAQGCSDNLHILTQTSPAFNTDWAVTCKHAINSGDGHFAVTGLVLSDGTKAITYGFNSADNMSLVVERWNTTSSSVGSNDSTLKTYSRMVYLRIENTGSNLLYSYSMDGIHFIQQFSAGNTAWFAGGPTQVGLHLMNIDCAVGNSSLNCQALFDWFRRTT